MTGRPSIVAPARADVTQGPDPLAGLPAPPGPCPFCPGAEAELERILARIPAHGRSRVRAVANRYPAVLPYPVSTPLALSSEPVAARGRQEIVIESLEHDADLASYERSHAADVLRMLRARLASFEADPAIAEVALFRNKGRRAGSTQPHPHSQLIGTAILGPEASRRFARAREHYASRGETLLDAVLRRELEAGQRVVCEEQAFIAIAPFAPKEKFECWVLPRAARGSFSALTDDLLEPLAAALAGAIRRALASSGRSDYNVLFRLPPVAERAHPAAFWYVEVLPRGGGPAGYELASGVPIVSVSPERAAAAMRAQR